MAYNKNYMATMLSFISTGSSVKEEMCLQDIWTDRLGVWYRLP